MNSDLNDEVNYGVHEANKGDESQPHTGRSENFMVNNSVEYEAILSMNDKDVHINAKEVNLDTVQALYPN